MFKQYGVPSDGFAPDFKGARPSRERSGTLVPDLGPRQLYWLRHDMKVFADANRRVEEVRAHSAEVAASMPAPETVRKIEGGA